MPLTGAILTRSNAGEFGVLLGMDRGPEKETIRDHLSGIAEHYLSNTLVERFAQRLLELNFIDREVFFIDGHFLPTTSEYGWIL
jgi:hypothetical protein